MNDTSATLVASSRRSKMIAERAIGNDQGPIPHAGDISHFNWPEALARFKRPHRLKSSWQIINTLLPFCALWYLMYLSVFWSYWLTLVLAIPTAGLLVRLFIIQHDCGHHSFFRSKRLNDALGRCAACSRSHRTASGAEVTRDITPVAATFITAVMGTSGC